MYSRYIPNGNGGFDRQRVQDAWDEAAEKQIRETGHLEAEAKGSGVRRDAPHPGGHDPPPSPPRPRLHPAGTPSRPQGPQTHPPGQSPRPGPFPLPGVPPRSGPPPRPSPGPPGRLPFFPAPGLLDPEGLLGRLLPRGLNTEELLVLAILLLSMKQDGAGNTELLIAAALYLLL